MSRYIDADKHLQKLRERRDTAIIWELNCNDEATKDRAQEAILIFNECISELIDAPTADVRENVRGEWRDIQIGNWHGVECTACKIAHDKRDVPHKNGGIVAWNFCPDCGAEMGGKS